MEGKPYKEVLDYVKEKVLDKATGNVGPHMYAYVMAGGNHVSIIAEKLATAINQNTGKWHLAPSINEIEKRVIRWTADMIDYTPEAGGIMVSGGSAANLAGLTVARNIFFEKENVRSKGLFGLKPFTVYASTEVHNCVDKSLEILGIGTEQLRKIPVTENYSIRVDVLEDQIEKDLANGFRPFCIVGTAGTVNTGAIDDLTTLAEVARKYDMWYRVDGAYGGLVAALPSRKAKYEGMELADSVALDFHKWLYQPFEAGCLIVRDWDTLRRAYYKKADYLDTALEKDDGHLDFNEHYFQLSRNTKAFKIWLSLKVYGFTRIRAMIQKDIDLARYLVDKISEANDFELLATGDLAIACFRYIGDLDDEEKITNINQALIPALEKDGRVFITGTKLHGRHAIRACVINHRKTKATTDYLLDVIREVAEMLILILK